MNSICTFLRLIAAGKDSKLEAISPLKYPILKISSLISNWFNKLCKQLTKWRVLTWTSKLKDEKSIELSISEEIPSEI